MLLFKTKYLKKKLTGTISLLVILLLLPLPITIGAIVSDEYEQLWMLLVIYTVFMIAMSLALFCDIQWYEVYEEKIVIKNVFGTVNHVKFENVQKIYETELCIFTKSDYMPSYIFLDGRKMYSFLYNLNMDNRKKFCVRVWITDELKAFIEEKGIEIEKKELCDIYFG